MSETLSEELTLGNSITNGIEIKFDNIETKLSIHKNN